MTHAAPEPVAPAPHAAESPVGAPPGAPPGRAAVPTWLRAGVFIVIVLELLGAQTSAVLLADGEWPGTPFTDPAQWIVNVAAIAKPLGAVAALVFAINNNLRGAVLGLATNILLAWLSMVPSAFVSGLGLGSEHTMGTFFASFAVIFQIFIAPALGVIAAALALGNRRLDVACALACLPTVFSVAGLAAFFIGVMIYGF